jgi:Cu+-exporting ATPase
MADVQLAEIDPVCGMKVLPEKGAASVHHMGRTWYFCAQGCKAKFEADPGKYDGSRPAPLISIAAAPKTPASAQYTCPMHPEVLS